MRLRKRIERAYWGFDSRTWDDLLTTEQYPRHLKDVAAWVTKGLRHPADVADLGCGTGNYTLELGRRGHRAVGVDFAPGPLERAEAKRTSEGLDNVSFRQADLTEPLPFDDASLDGALAIYSTQMIDPAPLLLEVARVLRPGGRLVLESPLPTAREFFRDVDAPVAHRVFFFFKELLIAFDRQVGLIKFRSPTELRALLEQAGLTVVDEHTEVRSIALVATKPGNRMVSFDRVADVYDKTRGGLKRGREVAQAIEPHLGTARRVLEVGVGTGVVATALKDSGRDVVGIDIATEMLRHAIGRIGPRVAQADAHRLPVATGAVAAAYLVWVLHLVSDAPTVMVECARVLAPGGRLVVVSGEPRNDPTAVNDIVEVLAPFIALRKRRLRQDNADAVIGWAERAGLEKLQRGQRHETFEESPAQVVKPIEERAFSFLWDLDERTWTTAVQPAIDGLRALPDQDRPRTHRRTQDLLVFGR